MQFSRHVNITGGALRDWFVAQCYDSVAVGLLWWAGLAWLHIPLAPLWAFLAALFQFIPHFGPTLTFIGPAIAAAFTGGLDTFLWLLGLYGVIVVVDGLLLQPMIMKRTARVPFWASLGVPILLSLMFGFWGLLIAAPLLAVIFAYRAVAKKRAVEAAERDAPHQTPPGQPITGGVLLEPENPPSSSEQP
ncbi:MAG TPA: AI-2E family transporter [Candidatus Angelobacter sp.]|nr:AI-2E family transporter [Candidatus Angelobacter sp.]